MRRAAIGLVAMLAAAAPTLAQDDDPVGLTPSAGDAATIGSRPSYSPYAGRSFPTRVYWGDTHIHTRNSLDARGFGVTLGPADAYRLARGEEVVATHGEPVKLREPLDWLVVADHSDGMGAMVEIFAGNPRLLKDPTVRGWYNEFAKGGDAAFRTRCAALFVFLELPCWRGPCPDCPAPPR
jgi:hypothetical protein